jgi:acyl-CoA synthetase (AMP-forming)/AMP-acid ligase II/acyl carrier protein
MDNAPTITSPDFVGLAALVSARAAQFPNRTAFTFEDDAGQSQSWTYKQLDCRMRTLGNWLAKRTSIGDRVLLVYPPGLEFIAAFFGCVAAGALPVPATYPKPRRPMPRLDSIVADCHPCLVLTHSSVLGGLSLEQQSPAISALAWEPTDPISTIENITFNPIPRSTDDLAFLQYTSGSTSEPRGVMVSHGNILHNLEAIRKGFALSFGEHAKGVFWLPAYHDMGLIGGILEPLYVGATATFIAPTTFLRRPIRWLELLSETQANISGAPDFGYELAAKKSTPDDRAALDLSRWRLAFCGAEPINPATLTEFATAFAPAGFKVGAFFPCYGLAESTLMVTGGQRPAGPRVLHVDRESLRQHSVDTRLSDNDQSRPVVSCGPGCTGLTVKIVNPQSLVECAPNQVGEVWIQGGSVARGYWNKTNVNQDVFRAQLTTGESGNFLRTGDLGFINDGELFVTGRLKDVIIIRGRNHYPHDLERSAQNSHEAVDMGAAFSIEMNGHEELVLVHQWRRECRAADHNQIIHAIRMAIVAEHEIDPHAIVLIRPASLPITSSGKVQRQQCREMYLQGELQVTTEWVNQHVAGENDGELPEPLAAPDFLQNIGQLGSDQLRVELQRWLVAWLTIRANLLPGTLQPTTPFAQLGIDSITAVEISQELDQLLGLQSPPMVIWSCPNPAELADFLAEELEATAKVT